MVILTVIIIYLLVVLGIGIWAARQVKNNADYIMGGYRMGIIPMTGTYLATFFSALSLLGGVGLIYINGIGGSWMPMTWALGSAIGPIIAIRYRRVRLETPTEYFAKRFGDKHLRSVAGVFGIVGLSLNLIVQFSAMGVVWNLATGRGFTEGVIIGAVVAIIYTAMGGFFAVAWTDVVQSVIFLICIFVGAILVMVKVGGPAAIYAQSAAIATPPAVGMDPTAPGQMLKFLGPYTAFSLFFTFLVQGPGTGTNPNYLQRMQASKNLRTALGMYKYAWILLILVYISLSLIGVGSRVLIPTLPEGIKTDWILPYFFQTFTHPVIAGLLFAALLAAAMSTIDSNIVVISSCFTMDIVKNYWPKVKESSLLWLNRLIVIVVGVIVVYMTIINSSFLVDVAGYAFGTIGLAYFVPLLFGLYWKRANRWGTWACIISGVITFFLCQAKIITLPAGVPNLGPGILVGIIFMIVVSLLTKPDKQELWEPYFTKPQA